MPRRRLPPLPHPTRRGRPGRGCWRGFLEGGLLGRGFLRGGLARGGFVLGSFRFALGCLGLGRGLGLGRRGILDGGGRLRLRGGGGLLCGGSLLRSGGRGVTATRDGAADDGQVGADRDGLVLLSEDLGQFAGGRGGDLGVDLVGGDLQQRLVDGDVVALSLQPAGDGALGDGLAQRRHRHGRAALDGPAAGRFGGGLLIGRGLLLRSLLLRCCLGRGLRCGRFPSGRRFLGSRGFLGRRLLLGSGCLLGGPTALGGIADHGEIGAHSDRLVLLGEDLEQHPGDRGRDLGVDLVGGDLQQRLVDRDLITDRLQPARHGAFGDGFAKCGHGHAFRHESSISLGLD